MTTTTLTIEAQMDSIIHLWHSHEEDETPSVDEYDILDTFRWDDIPAVLPYLSHPGNGYRAVAVCVCGCYAVADAAPVLYELLCHDTDSWVRELAYWALNCVDPQWHLYSVWDVLLLVLNMWLDEPQQMRMF